MTPTREAWTFAKALARMMMAPVCHNSVPSVRAASFAAIRLSNASTFYSTPELLFEVRTAADGALVQQSPGAGGRAQVFEVFAQSLNFTQECGDIIGRHGRSRARPNHGLAT